jgi:hypothetical protein
MAWFAVIGLFDGLIRPGVAARRRREGRNG